MKKLLLATFLLAIVFTAFNATVVKKNSQIIGEWKYTVAAAPDPYNNGLLVIFEKEGQLAGEVRFADGYKVDLKSITYLEDTLKCEILVDYETVRINAKIVNKKLEGRVNSPQGEMLITAEKVK